MFDDARHCIQRGRQFGRPGDGAQRTVIDHVAAVGLEDLAAPFAQADGRPRIAQRIQRGGQTQGGGFVPEGHHFDRQDEFAQARHQLGFVGDHDHAARRGGHDLFAQQHAAAALDQVQVAVGLVGAVNGQIERGQIVQRRQRDAHLAGQGRRLFGGRHAKQLEPAAHTRAQHFHEYLGGGAGAQPQLHAAFDIVQRLGGGGFFQNVLVGHETSGVMA